MSVLTHARPRVAHLTSVHRPDDVRIFRKECRTLAAAGYEVVLVAPGAEAVVIDGVRLHPIRRFRDRRWRLMLGWWLVLRAALEERAALYHFHDPELLPVGLLLLLMGKRVIYDAHEDVPGQIRSKHWISPGLRKAVAVFVSRIESFIARRCDAVVVAGEDIAAAMAVPGAYVIHNYPMLEEFEPAELVPYALRQAQVVHVGGMSRIRAGKELIEAIAMVPGELGPTLVLAGNFAADGLEAEVRALPGWSRTRYLGWSDRAQVAKTLKQSRVGVVLYNRAPNHMAVRSNKVFEYMAAGLPVVTPDFPAWRTLVDTERCGRTADPANPAAIAMAITELLRDPGLGQELGDNGRRAVLTRYSWEAEAGRLIALYRRLVPVSGNA